MVKVEYRANNSGGSWWLEDHHWFALEKAGWTVQWVKDEKPSQYSLHKAGEERWLGALAKYASKSFETPADAIREFEQIVGLDTSDDGCNCCGPPHSFCWGEGEKRGYASGQDIVGILYPGSPISLREAAEKMSGR